MSDQFCPVVGCGKQIPQPLQLGEPEHDYVKEPFVLHLGRWLGVAIAVVALACVTGLLSLIMLGCIKLAGSIW